MAKRRYSRADMADMIFDVLIEAGEDEVLTVPVLAAELRVTPAQVRNGIAGIRDMFAAEWSQPIVYDPATGYRFGTDRAEAERYEFLRLRAIITQWQRVITGTMIPATAKFRSPIARRTQKYAERIVEDLQELLAEVS